jgi:hypothetical protein
MSFLAFFRLFQSPYSLFASLNAAFLGYVRRNFRTFLFLNKMNDLNDLGYCRARQEPLKRVSAV